MKVLRNFEIVQIDVKSAFPNGKEKEELLIDSSAKICAHTNREKIFKLNKGLYGLNQAAHN